MDKGKYTFLEVTQLTPLGATLRMNTHDLFMLVLMLIPGILLSILVMATFAAGG
jgi:hypothetical protein